MKKILLVAAFVLGISAIGFAQGPPSAEEQTAALKSSLTLTDAQTAKVKVIYETQAKSRDSLFSAANGDFQAAIPKMMKMMEGSNAQIKAVLTPAQTPIFQKQIDEIAERMKQFQQGGGN